ncbi:hypothetical protein SG34_026610 [Thalassomonas viridans]|uniref:DUF4386 domain-containing protein n=1 Tax=Thalassomonas viridans TaxID=137584 RepID=A0AAF0C8K2_9GAMM|nr:hypothetical protein [Thalassomonas viridans]WDE04843.1 hypothetical protein SG34_026610 [Thalassomonas viridans]
MSNLQKIGGIAAISEALIYILAFIVYGAVLDYPVGDDLTLKFQFLADNQLLFSVMNLVVYVSFGILLALLVMALHERVKAQALVLSRFACVFGFLWVGLVIASGMIDNIGMAAVLKLSETEPEQARIMWLTVNVIVEGIGGGNEVVGGIWVLALSLAAWKSHALLKPLLCLGIFVGGAGISTIYPADVLTEIFGLSQIAWFLWVGIVLYREQPDGQKAMSASGLCYENNR